VNKLDSQGLRGLFSQSNDFRYKQFEILSAARLFLLQTRVANFSFSMIVDDAPGMWRLVGIGCLMMKRNQFHSAMIIGIPLKR
jgi:hypothetical protein